MKGVKAAIGDTMINANGYHHTKTESGWRMTHHLIAEAKYGRPINYDIERVKFADGNNKNLNPDNIIIEPKKKASASATLAKLIAQRAEIDAKIQELQKLLGEK